MILSRQKKQLWFREREWLAPPVVIYNQIKIGDGIDTGGGRVIRALRPVFLHQLG